MRTVLSRATDSGVLTSELRRCHKPEKKMSEEIKQNAMTHYCRDRSYREYIGSELSLSKMHQL